MKKRITVTVAITACFALCAAVWPQTEMVKETPVLDETTTVSAPKATVEELKTEVETVPPTEKEKTKVLQQEQAQEAAPEPEPAPTETPTAPEVQLTPEPTSVPEVSYAPTPDQVTESPAAQTTIEPSSGDMVYVEASAG